MANHFRLLKKTARQAIEDLPLADPASSDQISDPSGVTDATVRKLAKRLAKLEKLVAAQQEQLKQLRQKIAASRRSVRGGPKRNPAHESASPLSLADVDGRDQQLIHLVGFHEAAMISPDRAPVIRRQAAAVAPLLALPDIPHLTPDEAFALISALLWLGDIRAAGVVRALDRTTMRFTDAQIRMIATGSIGADPEALIALSAMSKNATLAGKLLLDAARLHWFAWDLNEVCAAAALSFQCDPSRSEALALHANALCHFARFDEAGAMAIKALGVNPLDRQALEILTAVGSSALTRFASRDAVFDAVEAADYAPYKAMQAALILADSGEMAVAITVLETALKRKGGIGPDDQASAQVLRLLSTMRLTVGDVDGAIAPALAALSAQAKPRGEAALALAHAYVEKGWFDAAIALLDLNNEPMDDLKLPAFQAFLGVGRTGEAFDHYRRRPQTKALEGAFPRQCPADFDLHTISRERGGKTIIFAEGGPGDEIRHSAVYAELGAMFGDLEITCDPRLESILSRSFPDIHFRPVLRYRREYRTNDYDLRSRVPHPALATSLDNALMDDIEGANFATSILNVLADLRPDVGSFQRRGACLVPNPELVSVWQDRLAAQSRPGVRRIALCWRSMLMTPWRSVHYVDVEDLAPLAEIENAEYWIAQTELNEAELTRLRAILPNVQVPTDLDVRDDFENLAALFVNMDHVIAPFVTNGEYAGALGCPTTLLGNSYMTTWRRMSDGTDIWHRSARLVIGDPVGDRAALMRAAVADIRRTLASASSAA